MKLLVFGSGFIASNFIEYWKKKYQNGEIVVLFNNYKIENKNVINYDMNIENIETILNNFLPDYIVCFQGNSFVADNDKIENAIENNVTKTSKFLELINNNIKKSIKKILLIGSAGEYGKLYAEPISESTNLSPNSLYGLSKVLLYEVSQYYVRKGLPIVYIRQFNTVGVGQQEKFVLPSFVKQIVSIEKKIIANSMEVGDLSQERDFIDIKDTCRAYDFLLKQGKNGEIYNVASGTYISISDLLDKIIDLSNLNNSQIKVICHKNKYSNNTLSKRLYADISKLEKLGFNVKYNIKDTIADMLKFWRNNV